MTAETAAKLERIKNRSTLYELVAVHGDTTILAGYCRKSRPSAMRMIRAHGARWVALTKTDRIDFSKSDPITATLGAWTFHFSGRTQREAILGGELPFITSLVAA